MDQRSGIYRTNSSGILSFVPKPLPPDLEIDDETEELLEDTKKALFLLDNLAKQDPDIIPKFIKKESLMSSRIEGIFPGTKKNDELIQNHISAMEYAVERIKTFPLCNRLIRETHAVLMKNTHEGKPGEFRKSQNWIGSPGSTLNTAFYVPPNPEDMMTAMSDLEKYMNAEDDPSDLVRAALIHYQFESIHPFLDGNGRTGRILIQLFLMQKEIISAPVLCASDYFCKHRNEYYSRLNEVRTKGDYEGWITFFLIAVLESALDEISNVTYGDILNS